MSEDENKTRGKLGVRDAKGRFVPGSSGNVNKVGGRPPVIRHIRELAREHTEPAFQKLLEIAMNGESETARVTALKEIFDRGWGKSAQPLTGADLGPIEIRRAKDLSDDELAAIIANKGE
jgi:hypothetical protein